MRARLLFLVSLVSISWVLGESKRDIEADYPLLPREQEIQMARAAGLAPWNQSATIYVMERQGFVVAEPGTNGFSCLVGRDHPGTAWPICFDPVGTETIVPRMLRETELRLSGKSAEEVRKDTAERFLSGAYRAPEKTGVAYMLNPEAVTFNGKNLLLTPPHLMIYAPNVTPGDVGAVNHPHSPMILFEGDPHAYLVVFVRDERPTFRKAEGR